MPLKITYIGDKQIVKVWKVKKRQSKRMNTKLITIIVTIVVACVSTAFVLGLHHYCGC